MIVLSFKFVSLESALPLHNSKGLAKSRIHLFDYKGESGKDPYAIAAKMIQVKEDAIPKLNLFDKKFYFLHCHCDENAKKTWYKINKNSLQKRLNITSQELNNILDSGTGVSDSLSIESLIKKKYTAVEKKEKLKEKEIFQLHPPQIIESTNKKEPIIEKPFDFTPLLLALREEIKKIENPKMEEQSEASISLNNIKTLFQLSSYNFSSKDGIQEALKDHELQVKEIAKHYSQIDGRAIISNLNLLAQLLKLIYTISQYSLLSPNIIKIVCDYSSLVADFKLTYSTFVRSCFKALEAYQLALKVAEKKSLTVEKSLPSSIKMVLNSYESLKKLLANETEKLIEISQKLSTLVEETLALKIDSVDLENGYVTNKDQELITTVLNFLLLNSNRISSYWLNAENHWDLLFKNDEMQKYVEAGMKEKFIEELTKSSLQWLSFGGVCLQAAETVKIAHDTMTKIMCNLPTSRSNKLVSSMTDSILSLIKHQELKSFKLIT